MQAIHGLLVMHAFGLPCHRNTISHDDKFITLPSSHCQISLGSTSFMLDISVVLDPVHTKERLVGVKRRLLH